MQFPLVLFFYLVPVIIQKKLCSQLLDDGILDHAEIEGLDTEVIAEVEDAVAFAESSPDPDPGDLFADVYHN